MIFEIPYWKDRLQAAKPQVNSAQLLQDLPDNPTVMKSNDGQNLPTWNMCPTSAPLIFNTCKGNIVVG